jgi:hypothetical protein
VQRLYSKRNVLELTITSPYLIVDSEVQFYTLTTINAPCSYSKLEQPIVKKEEGEGGREGGADINHYVLE